MIEMVGGGWMDVDEGKKREEEEKQNSPRGEMMF